MKVKPSTLKKDDMEEKLHHLIGVKPSISQLTLAQITLPESDTIITKQNEIGIYKFSLSEWNKEYSNREIYEKNESISHCSRT
jgi:hypothetical protein